MTTLSLQCHRNLHLTKLHQSFRPSHNVSSFRNFHDHPRQELSSQCEFLKYCSSWVAAWCLSRAGAWQCLRTQAADPDDTSSILISSISWLIISASYLLIYRVSVFSLIKWRFKKAPTLYIRTKHVIIIKSTQTNALQHSIYHKYSPILVLLVHISIPYKHSALLCIKELWKYRSNKYQTNPGSVKMCSWFFKSNSSDTLTILTRWYLVNHLFH